MLVPRRIAVCAVLQSTALLAMMSGHHRTLVSIAAHAPPTTATVGHNVLLQRRSSVARGLKRTIEQARIWWNRPRTVSYPIRFGRGGNTLEGSGSAKLLPQLNTDMDLRILARWRVKIRVDQAAVDQQLSVGQWAPANFFFTTLPSTYRGRIRRVLQWRPWRPWQQQQESIPGHMRCQLNNQPTSLVQWMREMSRLYQQVETDMNYFFRDASIIPYVLLRMPDYLVFKHKHQDCVFIFQPASSEEDDPADGQDGSVSMVSKVAAYILKLLVQDRLFHSNLHVDSTLCDVQQDLTLITGRVVYLSPLFNPGDHTSVATSRAILRNCANSLLTSKTKQQRPLVHLRKMLTSLHDASNDASLRELVKQVAEWASYPITIRQAYLPHHPMFDDLFNLARIRESVATTTPKRKPLFGNWGWHGPDTAPGQMDIKPDFWLSLRSEYHRELSELRTRLDAKPTEQPVPYSNKLVTLLHHKTVKSILQTRCSYRATCA